MKTETQYIYVFVRKDMLVEFQIVQACHASCVAGEQFGGSNSHMVLLGLSGPDELESLTAWLQVYKIPFVTFFESDDNMGNSAVATSPISGESRKNIKKIIDDMKLVLWKL